MSERRPKIIYFVEVRHFKGQWQPMISPCYTSMRLVRHTIREIEKTCELEIENYQKAEYRISRYVPELRPINSTVVDSLFGERKQ